MQEGRFHIMHREWLDPYMLDVKAVFDSVEERLRQYPDSLVGHALEQLRLLNPFRGIRDTVASVTSLRYGCSTQRDSRPIKLISLAQLACYT